MTATDELRRLLDERGVEYDGSFGGIEFYGEDGSVIIACNPKSKDGVLYVHACLTPEQAVEATLGSDLKAENAKLRELVRDYIDAPCTTCDCWQDEFRCWNYDGADCGLVARARELGVDA